MPQTPPPSATRILIADDHPMVRRALAEAMANVLDAVDLVEAGSLAQAFAALESGPAPDMLLLDLSMPGMNGLLGLAELRARHPAVPVVVVSATEEPQTIRRAAELGVAGYIPKSAPLPLIGAAIEAVLAGEVWLPEQASQVEPGAGERDELVARFRELTPQQRRVFGLVAEGRSNKLIAHLMEVSEATVKAHMSAILRKFGATSRTQLVVRTRGLTGMVAAGEESRPPARPDGVP